MCEKLKDNLQDGVGTMNLQSRKVRILIGIIIASILIISYRIVSNIQNERERAARMSQDAVFRL